MTMTPIFYFVHESLETKVDQNPMVNASEVGNRMFLFELCVIPVISN